jgi:hypothetical protein
MDEKTELELMSNIHAMTVAIIQLCERMMVLEATVSAIAKQQQTIAVRMGDDPKTAAASFEKAKNDAFDSLSETYAKHTTMLSDQALKARRKLRRA